MFKVHFSQRNKDVYFGIEYLPMKVKFIGYGICIFNQVFVKFILSNTTVSLYFDWVFIHSYYLMLL